MNELERKKTYLTYTDYVLFAVAVSSTAFAFGLLNSYHVSTLFENHYHFSHLSSLEREMSLKGEVSLYYSFYKTLAEAKTFNEGMHQLLNNRLVQYPETINSVTHYNLYPEIFIGFIYHNFKYFSKKYDFQIARCWVNNKRVNNFMTAADNKMIDCRGMAEPMYFYLQFVWMMAGLTVLLLAIYTMYISKSIPGTCITIMFYYFNHQNATYVHWIPLLRENIVFPFILINMMTLTVKLRKQSRSPLELNQLQHSLLGATVCSSLVLWQYSQLILSAQLFILFIMRELSMINRKSFTGLLYDHFTGIYLAIIIMQGNKTLLNSIYFHLLCSIAFNRFILMYFPLVFNYRNIYISTFVLTKNIIIVLGLTITCKMYLFDPNVADDDLYIYNLLRSKFTQYKDFRTMIYDCSYELFNIPLNLKTKSIIFTLLLPCVIGSIVLVGRYWILKNKHYAAKLRKMADISKIDKATKSKESAKQQKPSTSDNEKDKNLKEECPKIKLIKTKCNNGAGNDSQKKRVDPSHLEVKSCEIKQTSNAVKDYEPQVIIHPYFEVEPEIFFNYALLGVYAIMAGVIVRLNLFMIPQLCIMASLVASKRYWYNYSKWKRTIFLLILFFNMTLNGAPNAISQVTHSGEFQFNEPLKELLTWIEDNSEKNAAFAGPSYVTSSILLSTRRPIVNHPLEEKSHISSKTSTVYSVFSRRPAFNVYSKIAKLKITYLIIDKGWCLHAFYTCYKGCCNVLGIWDKVEPHLSKNQPLCYDLIMHSYVPHFQEVYMNKQFVVFKLHDNKVEVVMPNFPTFSI